MEKTTSSPLFVAISDVHFNLNFLDLAASALVTAINHANMLQVPLVVAGDLNDTKAIIRAEVANRLIEILKYADVQVFILVGNHDLVNEKGKEHSLNFLAPYATVIDSPRVHPQLPEVLFIPYQSDSEALKSIVHRPWSEKIFVMHQGFNGAFMGDYVQDKSSISVDEVAHVKVFSGHYHRHQNLGTVTYIGNPFTVSYGEANDGEKGFLVVNRDGSYEQIPLNLRKHKVISIDLGKTDLFDGKNFRGIRDNDLCWIKLYGPKSQLAQIKKEHIAKFITKNFKLEKYPNDNKEIARDELTAMGANQMLDYLIDRMGEDASYKEYVKQLWREVLNANS